MRDEGEVTNSGKEWLVGSEAFSDSVVMVVTYRARYALGYLEDQTAAARCAGADCSRGEAADGYYAEHVACGAGCGAVPWRRVGPWLAKSHGAFFPRLLDCLPQGEFEWGGEWCGEGCPLQVDVRGRHEDFGDKGARVVIGGANEGREWLARAVFECGVIFEVEHVWTGRHGRDGGGPAGDLDAELVSVVVWCVVLGCVDTVDVEAVLAAVELVFGVFGGEVEAKDGTIGACEAEGGREGLGI